MMQYNVLLHTPLGQRNGTLELWIKGNQVSGILNILKQPEPFTGNIDESGQCSITGTLVTLTKEIPYQADGQITKDALELSLMGDTGNYPMTGTRVQKMEGDRL